jgi:hypothetical protein
MLLPPTKVTEPVDILDVTPAVLPLVPMTITLCTAALDAEIVMFCAPAPTLTIPAPETFKRFENVPAELDVVFPKAVRETEEVCIAGDGTEIVTLPAPTPTEAIPAPEKLSNVLKEPLELDVVLPSAVRECV